MATINSISTEAVTMATFESVSLHFHDGSEPAFAMTSAQHTEGAWVVAKDPSKQQEYYDTAHASLTAGGIAGGYPIPIIITCERYEDLGYHDERHYWGVTEVRFKGVS